MLAQKAGAGYRMRDNEGAVYSIFVSFIQSLPHCNPIAGELLNSIFAIIFAIIFLQSVACILTFLPHFH